MKYNIGFTLGDPGGDGHACTTDYHIVAKWGAPAGCYEFDYAEEEFVDLYFAIVKYSLPDLEWSSRDLEEETLWDLYGAAYGFTYHGE